MKLKAGLIIFKEDIFMCSCTASKDALFCFLLQDVFFKET